VGSCGIRDRRFPILALTTNGLDGNRHVGEEFPAVR
jgi:hypothetical protein